MRAMIEREVAGQQDDDLRIETSSFDAHRDRLSGPFEFTIGIQAEPDIATQRTVVVSSFGYARTTEPSPIITMRDVELPMLSRSSDTHPTWREA
jgi:hypothetical protein